MKTLYIRSVFLLFSMLSISLQAENKQPIIESYQHVGDPYPPVLFFTNIENNEFKERLESYKAFSVLDSESVGLPIGVRILNGYNKKNNSSSLLLSASTLGLIPVVSNTEIKVYYQVFVQGKVLATFKYEMSSTDVDNFWAVSGERENKPAEELFIEYSIPKFLNELKDSKEVQAVFQEYREYFEES